MHTFGKVEIDSIVRKGDEFEIMLSGDDIPDSTDPEIVMGYYRMPQGKMKLELEVKKS